MPAAIAFSGERAALMGECVAFRRSLGFVMPEGPQGTLRHMAELPCETPPVPGVVDARRAERVAAKRGGESDRTRRCRLVVSRRFRPRLNGTGTAAYVPPAGRVGPRADFAPRIVGERETARITGVAEGGALRWPPMVPMMLRRAGMRIGEVAALAVGDLRRGGRSPFVAHAKNDRSRTIPVSESLAGDLGDRVDTHVRGGARAGGCSPAGPRGPPQQEGDRQPSSGHLPRGRRARRRGRAGPHPRHPPFVRNKGAREHSGAGSRRLRRSKAIHLVGVDVNTIYIGDFLGHASVETTEACARISAKSKQGVIEGASADPMAESSYNEKERSELVEWLKNLL